MLIKLIVIFFLPPTLYDDDKREKKNSENDSSYLHKGKKKKKVMGLSPRKNRLKRRNIFFSEQVEFFKEKCHILVLPPNDAKKMRSFIY